MTVSPEELLAGANPEESGNPDVPANPTSLVNGAPLASGNPNVPDSTAVGGASLLSGLPPAPPKGSVSESPRDQLLRIAAKNSDSLIQNASDPGAPGAWARALVGGMQSALAGVGNIGKVPSGAGALYGVGKVMQGNQEQKNEQRKQAAQEKQQKFENDYKLQEQKDREEARDADRLVRDVHTQTALRDSTKEAQDDLYNTIYKPWEKAQTEAGQTVIEGNMTDKELKAMALEHKTEKDPNGMMWLASQNRHQDGWRNVTDANGNIVQQTGPDGKPTGSPQRQATYSLLTWGDPLTVTKDIAANAKKYLGKDIKEGDILDPRDAGALKSQIGVKVVEQNAFDQAELAAGTTKEKLAELGDRAEAREAGHAFLPWVTDAKGDYGLAVANMTEAAAERDPKTGQPTQHAQDVQKQLDIVQAGMGQEIMKKLSDQWEKASVETIKMNAEKAKNAPLEAEGDTKLRGEAYINSLPAGRQPVMRAFINGQLPPGQLQRMLSSKDGQQWLAEAVLADPDIKIGAISNYVEAQKKYTSGPIANQLNSAGTGLVHLKALFEDNMVPGAFIGGQAWAKRQADLNDASKELARFLAGGTAPSNLDVEGAHASLDPSTLRGMLSTDMNLSNFKNSAVTEQAARITEKIQQYQSEWADAMPNERWKKSQPMPGISPEQLQAGDFLRNGGKTPTPAQSQFVVQVPGGSLTFKSQSQVDQYKAEIAKRQAAQQPAQGAGNISGVEQ